MYVCMYVCMSVYAFVCTYICTYTHSQFCMCSQTYAHHCTQIVHKYSYRWSTSFSIQLCSYVSLFTKACQTELVSVNHKVEPVTLLKRSASEAIDNIEAEIQARSSLCVVSCKRFVCMCVFRPCARDDPAVSSRKYPCNSPYRNPCNKPS